VKQKLCTFPEYPSVHSVSREVDVAQSFTDSDSFGIFKLFFHCRCCVLSIIVCLYALIPWSIVLYVPDRLLLYYMYLTVFYCIMLTLTFGGKKARYIVGCEGGEGCGGEENTGDIVTFSRFNDSLTHSLAHYFDRKWSYTRNNQT
jgi:hypothetical protein